MILTEEIINSLPILTEEEEKMHCSCEDFVKSVIKEVEKDLEDLDEDGNPITIL